MFLLPYCCLSPRVRACVCVPPLLEGVFPCVDVQYVLARGRMFSLISWRPQRQVDVRRTQGYTSLHGNRLHSHTKRGKNWPDITKEHKGFSVDLAYYTSGGHSFTMRHQAFPSRGLMHSVGMYTRSENHIVKVDGDGILHESCVQPVENSHLRFMMVMQSTPLDNTLLPLVNKN